MKLVVLVSLVLSAVSFAQVRQVVVAGGPLDRKVVGANNMKVVDANLQKLPVKYRPAAEAIGLMSMGCTGTHIGNGLVVSAGHCFSESNITKQRSTCAGVEIAWGVREGKQPTGVSKCTQVLVLELTNVKDYALFRVDRAPRVALKVRTQARPPLGTRITIFSHPFRQPLMWSGVCEISRSIATGLNPNFLHHRCDTNPGSSGAAILDAETLEVVGIHNGGQSVGQTGGANYGTYVDTTYLPLALQRLGYK